MANRRPTILAASLAGAILLGIALRLLLGVRPWVAIVAIVLAAFAACAALNISRRDRRHRSGQVEQAGACPEEPVPRRPAGNVGRNDPCPCGSGEKFKRCCGLAGGLGG